MRRPVSFGLLASFGLRSRKAGSFVIYTVCFHRHEKSPCIPRLRAACGVLRLLSFMAGVADAEGGVFRRERGVYRCLRASGVPESGLPGGVEERAGDGGGEYRAG